MERPDPSEILKELEALAVKAVLPEEAFIQYDKGNISDKFLALHADTIKNLSKRYIDKRGTEVHLSSEEIKSYSLYYLPINFIKVLYILNNLSLDHFKTSPVSILDFGCGPGSGALAGAVHFDNISSITLLDSSQNAVMAAGNFLTEWKRKVNKEFEVESLNNLQDERFDVIIAANVLTEFSLEKRESTLELLLTHLSDSGILLILEPAIKETTQINMLNRDGLLLKHHELKVIYPCPGHTVCPMNKEKDWCHGEVPNSYWEKTQLVRQLDKLTGFNKHRIKFSAFVFTKKSSASPLPSRLIQNSELKAPGIVCTPEGLISIHPKDKRLDEKNRRILKKGYYYEPLNIADGKP